MTNERVPIGVIMIERHGRVQTEMKFPLNEQGRYPLTAEARAEAREIGKKLYGYLNEQGLLDVMAKNGAYLHFAPSPYVRAIETGEQTALKLHRLLNKQGIKVQTALRHKEPVESLRFLKVPDMEHYPASKSVIDLKWSEEENAFVRSKEPGGKTPEGWEDLDHAIRRAKTPAMLRKEIVRRFLENEKQNKKHGPFPVHAWISHGPGAKAEDLTEPRSPIGFALKHLFSPKERQQFNLPVELVRGQAVAAIVYSDGSVHARHLKPGD